jgi:DUF1680 family protein
MKSSRRDFLKASATATAAASLAPLAAHAESAAKSAIPESALPAAETPAAIKAFERRLQRARPLPLGAVRITGGPLRNAQDLTAKYLLALDPDRMMAHYRVRAGLRQKAEPYVGWDGGGRNLTGHIAGHHLSAVSIYYKVTGDPAFKKRADYLVAEMKEVQDKRGDGYLGAIMTNEQGTTPAKDGHEVFKEVAKGDIRSGAFDLNGLWSPWYTLHKTFAGLRDAYRLTGNKMALEVETRFAKWAEGVLAPLSDEQLARMHNTEFGGMNEVLADLYADTGDKRWLDLSYKFEHHAFTGPLKRHQDNLSGKHGNCQIPKLIGSATRYGFTADSSDLVAAAFFHDRVAQHHSYATGGHGLAEYFGAPDQLSPRVDGRTCETCNCYNMLKLTRKLFAFTPDPTYADFHERTLFNHILASIDNEDGRTSYMVPVGRAVSQEYADMQRSFTCCVGSGMESHGLHGDGMYFESDDAIWVNFYAPSTAQFVTQPVSLEMTTGFPDGDTASIKVTAKTSKEFTLAVRRPVWAGDGFVLKVNGAVIPTPSLATMHDPGAGGRRGAPGNEAAQGSSYVPIKRTWKTGDVVEISLPKSLRLEPTPDNKTVAAIMWGPLVLAGNLAPRQQGRGAAVVAPVLVTNDRPVSTWVTATGTTPGDFSAKQVGRLVANPTAATTDVVLTPFHRTHKKVYSVYFDVLNETEYYSRVGNFSAERERVRRLELATISFIAPGDPEAEKNYTYASDQADRAIGRAGGGRTNRAGTGWFSYNMPVEPLSESALIVTYFTDIGQPPTPGSFQISVEGTVIARYEPNPTAQGYHDTRYAIPMNLTREKARVTVKFEALAGTPPGRIAPIFGVRVVRTKDL